MAETPTTKNLGLEGIRGLAAFVVVASHCIVSYRPSLYDAYWPRLTHSWEKFFVSSPLRLLVEGNGAVCIFFVLSGQVLTRGAFSESGTDLSSRFLRRPIRLGVPLLVTNLLMLVLLRLGMLDGSRHPTFGTFWPIETRGELSVWSAVHSAFVGTPFRGDVRWQIVHWSLPFEFLGSYLIIAVAATLGRRRNVIVQLGFLAILVGWLWSPYYSAFVVGAMCSAYFDGPMRTRVADVPLGFRRVGVALAAAGGVLLLLRPLHPFGPWTVVDDVFRQLRVGDLEAGPHVLGAAMLYFAAQSSSRTMELLSARPLVQLGEASFGIYLLHVPFLYAITWRIQVELAGPLGTAGSSVAAVAATMIAVPLVAWFGFRPIDHLAVDLGARLVPRSSGRVAHRNELTTPRIADAP